MTITTEQMENFLKPIPPSLQEKTVEYLYCTDRDKKQVDDLIVAGFRFEIPTECNAGLAQWYWRAPLTGRARKGRKFLSTNQAWNYLQKSRYDNIKRQR